MSRSGWNDYFRRLLGWNSSPSALYPSMRPDQLHWFLFRSSAFVDKTDTSDCPVCNPCVQFRDGFSTQTEFDRWWNTTAGTATVVDGNVVMVPGTTILCRSRTNGERYRITAGVSPDNALDTDQSWQLWLDYQDANNYHGIDFFAENIFGFEQQKMRYFKVEGGATSWETTKEIAGRFAAHACWTDNYIAAGLDSSPVTTPFNGTQIGIHVPASNPGNITLNNFEIGLGPDENRSYQCPWCQLGCNECLNGGAPFAFILEVTGNPAHNGTHRLEMSPLPWDQTGCVYTGFSGNGTQITLIIRNQFVTPLGWTGQTTPWQFELYFGAVAGNPSIDDGAFDPHVPTPCLGINSLPLNKALVQVGAELQIIDRPGTASYIIRASMT